MTPAKSLAIIPNTLYVIRYCCKRQIVILSSVSIEFFFKSKHPTGLYSLTMFKDARSVTLPIFYKLFLWSNSLINISFTDYK